MHLQLPASFKPDGDSLLRRISQHIDDATLEHIAGMEPTGSRLHEHLAPLRKIRDHCIVDRPLHWIPGEVLEFTRWHEPDDPDWTRRNRTWPGARGHWVRAYGDAETRQIEHSGYNVALIQVLGSLRALDVGLEQEAMASLAWFIERLRTSNEANVEEEIAFAGLGLLWLATRPGSAVRESAMAELIAWFLAQEKRSFDEWNGTREILCTIGSSGLNTQCSMKSGSPWLRNWPRSKVAAQA